MKIETKFSVGQDVEVFKEGIGVMNGVIDTVETWHRINESSEIYVVKLSDGKSIRLHAENINKRNYENRY